MVLDGNIGNSLPHDSQSEITPKEYFLVVEPLSRF